MLQVYSLLNIRQVTYHTATGSVAVCKWNITSLGQFVRVYFGKEKDIVYLFIYGFRYKTINRFLCLKNSNN
jgi:hypothetical protein